MDNIPKRTQRQNRALHKLFGMLAKELNDNGLDMRKTLKPTIDIPWSAASVKEYLWRPVQIAQVAKQSTTELNTKEIDEVFETLNRFIGERHGLHVAFPSVEIIMRDQEASQR